jgi:uncharacterized membrane protein YphA (DoxX/SURF4 family)
MVFVRIGLGALLLFEGLRLYRDRVGPELVESTAHRMSVAPEVYAWFGSNIVLRYPSFFAWAIVAGLFASGAALFVGALVRPASVAVLFLMANFHFAGPAVKEEYRALIAIVALGCFIAGAGMRVGLDAYLVGRFPAWITWSR